MPTPSISLRFWLPLLFLATAAMLWSFMTWHAYHTLQSDLTASSLRAATEDLTLLQMQMELMLSRGQPDDAGRLVSAWGVDTRLQDLVSMSNDGQIMHATRLELIGQPVAMALTAFDQQRFDRLRRDNRPDVQVTPDGQRILAYMPLTLARPAGAMRSSRTGALFAIYDLSSDRLQIWDRAWRFSLLVGLALFLATVILMTFVRYFITSPFRGLVETVHALTRGESGALSSIKGEGELADLGGAFNKMSRKLEERGRQRDESLAELQQAKLVVESSPVVLFCWQATEGWPVEYVSENVTQFGYSPEQLLSGATLYSSLVHPEDLDRVVNELEEHSAAGLGELKQEYRILTANGDVRWVDEHTTIIRDANGNVTHYQGVVVDGTERKRADLELHRFRQIFESVNDMVALVSKDYVHLTANPLYLKYHDRPYDEVIGHLVSEVFGEEFFNATIRPEAERCMTGEDVQFKQWIEFKGVGRKCMSISCSPYFGTGVKIDGFVIVARDVTREVELQLQVQQAQKLETIGQLAGGVAHDFNNMCGVILGYTDLALDETDKDRPLHHQLTEIRTAAQRSADLARQLLTFASKQAVSPKLLGLNQIVKGMLNMLRQLIGENIELQWRPGEGLRPVKMDPSQLDQLVVNLCINARDAIPDVGRITIRTGMAAIDSSSFDEHPDAAPGEYLVLTISDDGHGMDEQTQARLFDPFFTTRAGGTGLGLATVYGIVRQAGGFIRLRSEVDRGTTFRIHLPVTPGEIEAVPETATMDENQRGQETILLVEDEPALLEVAKMMLELKGYAVLAAQTPGEATLLAEAHSADIDLVLTDVIMSEMSGPELVCQLRSAHPKFRYLLMSGYTASENLSPGLLGADLPLLPKPFSSRELCTKVREVLDG